MQRILSQHNLVKCTLRHPLAALLVAAVASSLLLACAEGPPGCSDERVLEAVRKIAKEQIEEELGSAQRGLAELVMQRTTFSLTTVQTIRDNSGNGGRSCVGVLVADAPPKVAGSLQALRVMFGGAAQQLTKEVKVDGSKMLVDVSYTAALTDDQKQFVLNMQGINPLTDVLATLARQGLFEQQQPAQAQASPVKPPEVSVPLSPIIATNDLPKASGGQQQPSFSCTGDLGRVEKMICASVALSSFDASLAKSYAEALQRSADAAAVKQKQRAWIKERNACAEEQCLIAIYGRRADELTQ